MGPPVGGTVDGGRIASEPGGKGAPGRKGDDPGGGIGRGEEKVPLPGAEEGGGNR